MSFTKQTKQTQGSSKKEKKMPGAGIQVDDSCLCEFESFKLRNKYSWITFKIEGGKVVIDQTGQPEQSSFDDLVETLKIVTQPRYAVLHYKYSTSEDGNRSKLVFVHTTPHSSTIREKMVYAATKVEFKKMLTGLQIDVSGLPEEVHADTIQEKCNRFA